MDKGSYQFVSNQSFSWSSWKVLRKFLWHIYCKRNLPQSRSLVLANDLSLKMPALLIKISETTMVLISVEREVVNRTITHEREENGLGLRVPRVYVFVMFDLVM